MENKNYSSSITVDKTAEEVFTAINNVRGWWQGDIKGSTEHLNDEFTYQMGDIHFSKQKVIESIPNRKVVWLVTESKINFVDDKEEWLDTRISFEITQVGNKTKLTFTHEGLVPAIECYDACSGAWGKLIDKSLFSLITKGEGVEIF